MEFQGEEPAEQVLSADTPFRASTGRRAKR